MVRQRALKVVIVVVGLLFTAAICPIVGSLRNVANQSDYADDMMMSLYFALGIFLLIAARNPSANRSLIAFTAWSSFAHAVVMSVLGIQHTNDRADFLSGSAVLVVIGNLDRAVSRKAIGGAGLRGRAVVKFRITTRDLLRRFVHSDHPVSRHIP